MSAGRDGKSLSVAVREARRSLAWFPWTGADPAVVLAAVAKRHKVDEASVAVQVARRQHPGREAAVLRAMLRGRGEASVARALTEIEQAHRDNFPDSTLDRLGASVMRFSQEHLGRPCAPRGPETRIDNPMLFRKVAPVLLGAGFEYFHVRRASERFERYVGCLEGAGAVYVAALGAAVRLGTTPRLADQFRRMRLQQTVHQLFFRFAPAAELARLETETRERLDAHGIARFG